MTFLFSQTFSDTGSGFAAFLPFLLIGVIFYFLIIRPQSTQKKQHDTMLNNLKKGDKILTRGGLYGKVVNFKGKNNQKITNPTFLHKIETELVRALSLSIEDLLSG